MARSSNIPLLRGICLVFGLLLAGKVVLGLVQGDITYEQNKWLQQTKPNNENWQFRFQIEAGI